MRLEQEILEETGSARFYIDKYYIHLLPGKLPYSHYIYSKYIGTIPDNYKIIHLDSDPFNCLPENLEAVPKSAFRRPRSTPRLADRKFYGRQVPRYKQLAILNLKERGYSMKEVIDMLNIPITTSE